MAVREQKPESIRCSIGIHLRNPCGAYRPIATAVYNPKAQDRLPMHGNGG